MALLLHVHMLGLPAAHHAEAAVAFCAGTPQLPLLEADPAALVPQLEGGIYAPVEAVTAHPVV